MLTVERQNYIRKQLQTHAFVKSQALMHALSASESTIRRDLAELEARGELMRIHGGAQRVGGLQDEPDVAKKATQQLEAKQQIAQAAVALIRPHNLIYLDAGTTTAQMIPLLRQKDVTVVTPGVDNASLLADHHIKTFMLGGLVKSTTKASVGAATAAQLDQYRFDQCFLGTNGVHLTYGLTTPDPEEAALKRLVIAHTATPYVIADNTKFDHVSFTRFATLEEVTILTQAKNQLPKAYQQLKTVKEALS